LRIIQGNFSGTLPIGYTIRNHIRFFQGKIMAKLAVQKRFPFGVVALLAIAYIAFGDAFLPGAAGKYSYQTRLQLNAMMIKIMPGWKARTNPNRRTEDAVEQMGGNK
jgi:hypothetical protein